VEQNRKAGQNPPRVVTPTEEEEEGQATDGNIIPRMRRHPHTDTQNML